MMFAPTYLSEADRKRLIELNQNLLSGNTGEEYARMEEERNEIMKRQKKIADCTYEELQELRQQLFELYQKHLSIKSSQTKIIASYIQQVEFRANLVLEKQANETKPDKNNVKEPSTQRKRSPDQISSKRNRNSWSVDFNKFD